MDFPAIDASNIFLAVSVQAQPYVEEGFLSWFTNSIFVAVLVLFLVLAVARKGVRNMQLVPHKAQNFFEFLVEFLYNQVEGIVGPKVAPKAFPLLATIFIFILTANWFGLIPGVGTMGFVSDGGHSAEHAQVQQYLPDTGGERGEGSGGGGAGGGDGHGGGEKTGFLTVSQVDVPLLRPATADLNMTLGIALCFMLIWLYITFQEVGVVGFIKHVFAPKGGLKGALAAALLPIFLFVGVIELISIAFRPVSLSLRLFGNIFAGENLLHQMMHLGESFGAVGSFISSIIFPLPFYFLELLVGLIQAIVFALLCAVYIQLSTTHDEHEEH